MNTPISTLAPAVPTPDLSELSTLLTEIKSGWANIKDLPATLETLQDHNAQLSQHVTDLRRLVASRPSVASAPAIHQSRHLPAPSDDCAEFIAAQFIAHCERSGRLDALTGRLSAYYLDTTWEARLPGFRTNSDPNIYQRRTDGAAVLDGYPIVWTDVLTLYGTAATPDLPLAVFGALSFWWFGEHGSPRLDTSIDVFFANDQLAVRFIEEIDFDYCASNATAALLTAAV